MSRHWCAKFERWTTTRTTTEHHGERTRSYHPQWQTSAEANFSLVPDPSAWHASFGGQDLITIFDLCLLVGPYLVTMMITLLCLSQQQISIISTFLVTYQWALLLCTSLVDHDSCCPSLVET